MSPPESRPARFKAWLSITAVCLVLRGAVFMAIVLNQPAYLHDYQLSHNPDSIDYVTLGRNFWIEGRYSREPEPPYRLDAFRTPVFPVLVGFLQTATGEAWPIYLLQVLCSTATALLVYEIGLLWDRRIALLAGLLFAADLALAINDFLILTECLFAALSTLSVWLWLKSMDRPWTWSAYTGLAVGTATLVRPTGLYLIVVFAAVQVLARRPVASSLRKSAVLAACTLAIVVPWMARNYAQFDLFTVSTVQNINLVYSLGAGAYQQEFGVSRQEAGDRIEREFELPSFTVLHHAWLSDKSVRELDLELREALPSLLTKYPRSLTIACGKGVAKSLVAHDNGNLAYLAGGAWTPPSFNNLMRGDFGAFARRLTENHGLLIAAFLYQVLWNVLTLAFGFVGVVRSLRDPARCGVALCLLGVIAYWLATICVMGPDATARYRFPLLPLWYVFAAAGCRGGAARPK